jgi:hypothetical protein
MLRIRAALENEQGLIVNKKIMCQLGLKGLPGPRKGVKNLKNGPTCEDLVQRRFVASTPNELWLTDIPNTPQAKASSTAVSCWTCTRARSWAGPSTAAAKPCWSTTPSLKRARRGHRHPARSFTPTTAPKGELNWSSQHLDRGGVDSTMRERQKQVQLYRGQIPSPGAPTVAWREDRVRFWVAIARGVKTDVAAAEARVSSPVGYRWFRHAGGVNPLPAGDSVGPLSLVP